MNTNVRGERLERIGANTDSLYGKARTSSYSVGVPVLRESDRSIAEQVDSFERWLESVTSTD